MNQVGAPHDMVDALIGIIDHHGKLIGKVAIGAQQYAIANIMKQVLMLLALHGVVKVDTTLNAQTPGAGGFSGWQSIPAGARIHRRTIHTWVRARQFAARTAAGIDDTARLELRQHFPIPIGTPALHHYRSIPFETKGFKRTQDRIGMRGLAARLVDIFHAHQPTPAACLGFKV